MIKKYTARPGQKVTIEINRKAKAQSPAVKFPKGLIDGRREDDYQARRLRKGEIKLYDLGLAMAGGVPAEVMYGVPVTLTTDPLGTVSATLPTLAEYKAFTDYLLAGGVENLETNYRQIDQATGEYMQIHVFNEFGPVAEFENPEDTHWRDGKLKLAANEIAGYLTFNLYFAFHYGGGITVGPGGNKITATYDPDAEDAGFVPKNTDTYFFVPQLAKTWSQSSAGVGEYMFSDHRVCPRTPYYLDEDSFLYHSYELNPAGFSPMTADEWNMISESIEAIRSYGINLQGLRRTFNTLTFTWDWTTMSPDDYPNAVFPNGSGAFSIQSSTNPTFTPIPAGALVAVIKQGNQYFYVWK